MNSLIFDWCEFCEGKKSFDKSHFYTLFWENIKEEELKNIFKYFPNSDRLLIITKEYLFGNNKGEKLVTETTPSLLIKLALEDLNQKSKLLNGYPDLLKKILDLEVEFIYDFKLVEQKKSEDPYSTFFSEIEFELTEKWIIEDKKAYALYEAFYGLVKTYEVVWHLFSPLIDTQVNFENYIKLTRLGGLYAFSDTKLLVSRLPSTRRSSETTKR